MLIEYRVYYDIQQVTYPGWGWVVFSLIFISAGAGFLLARNNKAFNESFAASDEFRRTALPVVAILFGLIGVGVVWHGYSDFAKLRDATRRGDYEVLEGRVEEFTPERKRESFVVGGRRFEYWGHDGSGGFSWTKARGGPIREGSQIRVAYIGDKIVKLEIAN